MYNQYKYEWNQPMNVITDNLSDCHDYAVTRTILDNKTERLCELWSIEGTWPRKYLENRKILKNNSII